MTAYPPTTRNLTSCLAKTANRSLKCELLSMVGSTCMRFQNHLPGRFEDRRRPLALPVVNIEFAACPVHWNHAGHEESLLVPIAASHRHSSIIGATSYDAKYDKQSSDVTVALDCDAGFGREDVRAALLGRQS